MTDEKKRKQKEEGLTVDNREAQSIIQNISRRGDGSLASDIERRYLRAGVQWLSDDAPGEIDEDLRSRVERYTGQLPSDVRVHTGERAQQAAAALGAKAFAVGQGDIFLGKDSGASDSERQAVLAHELAHTAQAQRQQAGVPPVAMSSPAGGRQSSERQAYGVESMVLAEEQDGGESSQDHSPMPTASQDPNTAAEKESAMIDMNDLERRVWQVLKEQARRSHDLTGMW